MEETVRMESPVILIPSPSVLLRKRILTWSKENSNEPISIRVHVDGKIFHLHEYPLASKSGFFRKVLKESSMEIELPDTFPGGSDAFEMAVLFCYDSPLRLDPFNVLELRCAASFLEMTECYFSGNLCEQTDLYLNQVVLQSWDDTLIVLQKCWILTPWAEELLITSRCVESLAFMASMEMLDPEREREEPIFNLQIMIGRAWSCEEAKKIAGKDSWVKELIALPFEFFDRIIRSLRIQGMEEKCISPLIVLYANKWVISKKTHKYLESADESSEIDLIKKVSVVLQGLLELLPLGEKGSKAIPVSFYFAMLSRSVSLGLTGERRSQLEEEVASLLQFARVEDFLLPESKSDLDTISSSIELKTMERIFSLRLSSKHESSYNGSSPINTCSMAAGLWDRYLSIVAADPKLGTNRFTDLIETVPITHRESHDHLYKAMAVFLQKHPHISCQEKASVCKYLDCRKLSQPTCVQVVRNELMPLRSIVQALSIQQEHTQQAFKDFSESFRFALFEDFSGSLLNSRSQALLNHYLGESQFPRPAEEEDDGGSPLEFIKSKQKSGLNKGEYEPASFRIQVLEGELMALKRSLKEQDTVKQLDHFASKTRQCDGCNGRWGSHRKRMSRLLNAFRRLRMTGKGKAKMRKVSSE